ncbi:hypothetical protein GIB67_035248 [Kingdonia uniflora]|uniref:Methyltransferase domain-containing protein n=1 Tax=Kingdonia uniflora TaxID=39325 RepID=A0A7J7KXW3_9MAGN|nr:hypothetical protein GIB67_035248 [Kingdonia uniflora]
MAECRKHTCKSANETLEWINSITCFLTKYRVLLDARLVDFFKDKLWETVDKQWIDCLSEEPVENLLKIPSGVVQDYWPDSLKEFVLTLRSLVLPREQGDLRMMFPEFQVPSLSSVLVQGMDRKKKHEVELLASVVNSIARNVGAQTTIDVGAGQGYLAQVLSFHYQLPVIAIDASSHHGKVTGDRAERIKKHYAAQVRKQSSTGGRPFNIPKIVTCHVLSSEMLKALSHTLSQQDKFEQSNATEVCAYKPLFEGLESEVEKHPLTCKNLIVESSLLLAGLHACGDLSVTMLRTFLECKEVKALVSIGCCYNLLSEEGFEDSHSQCGFPISDGLKLAGFSLGKVACDLACQSAERWRSLTKSAAQENFHLHAFRAAFQMFLCRTYPEVFNTQPSIGRQGKALRRRQLRKAIQIQHHTEETTDSTLATTCEYYKTERICLATASLETGEVQNSNDNVVLRDGLPCSSIARGAPSFQTHSIFSSKWEASQSSEKISLFEKFCESGLQRLDLEPSHETDCLGSWMEAEPFTKLVGPYWSLRAALGPLVETLLLLDRLLFLQEQGSSVEAFILPLFDPILSPRNVAIIAWKVCSPSQPHGP